jgi:hypothetical protein
MNYIDSAVIDNCLGEIIIPTTRPLPKRANDSSQIYIWVLNKADKIIKNFTFYGQEFEVHVEDDEIILTHPTWSLSGMGKSFLEAERNLIQESKIALEHYINIPDSQLSEEAIKMKDFILQIP